ncbi:hypothetical protein WJX81_002786 [Elliptochloris bilobata]|uniref:Large ribosomal subunit protein bL33c n=1 Tax=Elliptochloris bilobata TaxID=381761 RepID=A0AAW1SIZ7_9CHLO
MAKGKGALLIKLLSTAGTGYFYVKKKNPRTLPNKLQLMKYDPRVKRHRMTWKRDAALVLLGAAGCALTLQAARWLRQRAGRTSSARCGGPVDGVEGLIGNTPLVRIRSLSELTGCEILGKAEFLNPGGSIKDRIALAIVREALEQGGLRRSGLITEGSAGSTGISLAMVAAAHGCRCAVALPDDAASEKAALLEALGARVLRQRPVSIAHPQHFVNVARRETNAHGANGKVGGSGGGGAVFADQFENLGNYRAHLATGAEIWAQTGGRLDAFVSGAGTGGTIAGVSRYLKARDPRIQVVLIDPPGSSLFNAVMRGVAFAREEAEGTRLRHPCDTITEGIGINRLTANFLQAQVDSAFQGTDREAVEMAAHLLRRDGLFLGSSAAMNCIGAVKVARKLGPGHTIVTVLCDGGHRHLSRFHSSEFLASVGLTPQHCDDDLGFVA